jgi:hypothetical protein
MKFLTLIAALSVAFGPAFAEAPKKPTLAGVTLGQNPEQAKELLRKQYPGCDIEEAYYLPDLSQKIIGQLSISVVGKKDKSCELSQEASGRVDQVRLAFAHPDVHAGSGLYEIQLTRSVKTDSAVGPLRAEEIVSALIADFGEPTATRIGVDKPLQDWAERLRRQLKNPVPRPEDTHLSYEALWSSIPTRDVGKFCFSGSCGSRTMKVKISGKGLPTSKLNGIRVEGLITITLKDEDTSDAQTSWITDQQMKKKLDAVKF